MILSGTRGGRGPPESLVFERWPRCHRKEYLISATETFDHTLLLALSSSQAATRKTGFPADSTPVPFAGSETHRSVFRAWRSPRKGRPQRPEQSKPPKSLYTLSEMGGIARKISRTSLYIQVHYIQWLASKSWNQASKSMLIFILEMTMSYLMVHPIIFRLGNHNGL